MNRRSFFGALIGALIACKQTVSTRPSLELGRFIHEANATLVYAHFPLGARKGDLLGWAGDGVAIPFGRFVGPNYPPLAGIAMSDIESRNLGWVQVAGLMKVPFRVTNP